MSMAQSEFFLFAAKMVVRGKRYTACYMLLKKRNIEKKGKDICRMEKPGRRATSSP